ncbi:uncharacterized protein LOC129578709 [Sitodiplosis mosellana]|uniref:uncharacterized protein LOC129578709 n=1 Tax=Sitodiplosis mosellana TaxID=263140 RepID=UPI00244429FB|nr:uncharacterized protein LOC129578709 [Sitodiplosis mosellana]
MKREKKTPTKVKSRKISTSSSSSSSVDQSQPESNVVAAKQQKQPKETRVLVEESNQSANKNQANVTVRLENADSLAKYRNKYPHIQIENPKTTTNFAADEISDDDEIWLFDVPATIDVKKLIGKSIKLGSKKSTIKTDDDEIEYNSTKIDKDDYQNTLSVVFQNKDAQFSIKNIKPVGRVQFHQKIDDTDEPVELTPSGRHPCTIFPENLKVRHPLLGHQFEDKIKLSKTIKEKLMEAKTVSEQESLPSVRAKQEKEENRTSSQISPKKSKKRKAESADDTVAQKKLKEDIKMENGHDDDLAMIKQIFAKNT